MLVPPSGFESTEIVPFTSRTRSSMLVRPGTSTLHCRFQVEPSPQITDEEMNPTGVFQQLYFNPFSPRCV